MTKEKPSRSHLAPFRAHTNQHTDTPTHSPQKPSPQANVTDITRAW